ncbi:response regulator transcription factor [Solwaraspora sp. WMMD1047]|uniref:response regulator transcription factor n=1 Tax=Solwaraspora sp. WMMD1047 TaxID=3016102 RepID=UPI002415B9A6|nr:response regulator transcription factor [Solwaraspora sp. WMMD1047]MDG4830048.1 response regulator transcription factor [Solwaraspora sp. WMMD1047]
MSDESHIADTMLVVDDHPVVRRGLVSLLAGEPGVARVVEAGGVVEARRLATLDRPRCALVDLALPDGDGVGLVRELLTIVPGCAVVVMTMTNDPGTVRAAGTAGARGYLLKDTDPETLLAAIRTVRAGGRAFGPGVADDTPGAPARPGPLDSLSPRDRQLLALLVDGRSTREIARSMSLSEKTVRNQISIISGKLGVSDRVQAALVYHRAGLAG